MQLTRTQMAASALAALTATLVHAPAAQTVDAGADGSAAKVELEKLHRPGQAQPSGDLFGPRSWQPRAPQKKAPPPPAPPPPQAPPLPYQYLGRWIEKGDTLVYLARQDRNYLARLGQTLDGTYRIESISDDRLVLRYLPLGTAQILPYTRSAGHAVGPARAPTRDAVPAMPDDEEHDEAG
jgi:hypothetical protein